jgi:hypothetical protein
VIAFCALVGLHERQHMLAAYCARCNRWAVLPLADMSAEGRGSLRLPFTVRCQDCGEVGQLQVRPPVPTLDPHRAGWISPR